MLIYLAASLLLDAAETNGGASSASAQRWLGRARQVGADRLAGLAYYVGLPFTAMLAGAADFPLHLGLAGMDWPASLARGAATGLAVFIGLASIRWYVWRFRADSPALPDRAPHGWAAWLVALCHEAHWAFYRLPWILLTGDFLLGAFLGAALALMEQVGDPRWRRQATGNTALSAWLDVALLVGMSAGFYFVRNFFVLWGIHAALVWAGRKTLR